MVTWINNGTALYMPEFHPWEFYLTAFSQWPFKLWALAGETSLYAPSPIAHCCPCEPRGEQDRAAGLYWAFTLSTFIMIWEIESLDLRSLVAGKQMSYQGIESDMDVKKRLHR